MESNLISVWQKQKPCVAVGRLCSRVARLVALCASFCVCVFLRGLMAVSTPVSPLCAAFPLCNLLLFGYIFAAIL